VTPRKPFLEALGSPEPAPARPEDDRGFQGLHVLMDAGDLRKGLAQAGHEFLGLGQLGGARDHGYHGLLPGVGAHEEVAQPAPSRALIPRQPAQGGG